VLRRALREATRAFLAVTDSYTLADLVRPRARLRTLLKVG
jgi:DNA-binding IscR family transcriptional regulator